MSTSKTSAKHILLVFLALISFTNVATSSLISNRLTHSYKNINDTNFEFKSNYFFHFSELEFSDESESEESYYTTPPEPLVTDEDFSARSLLLKILIFICCAAGCFGVCSLCCIICGHCCATSGASVRITRQRERNGGNVIILDGTRQNPLQQRDNETIIAFFPYRPNSESSQELKHEHDDLPPSYDDLSPRCEESNCRSPSPPPYTPSFNYPEKGKDFSFNY